MKRHLSKSLTWILLALIISQIAFIGLVYPNTPVEIGRTVQKAPYESNPTSHVTSGLTVTTPVDSYDRQLDTWAEFRYTGVTGSFELKSFNTTGHQFDTIGWVDIKISYRAGASVDDQYRIIYYVGTTGPVTLQDWVNGSDAQFRPGPEVAQAHRDWSMRAEPIDGVWTWADIGNLRIVFETRQVDTEDAAKYVRVYEAWLSVYQSPKPPDGVSVQPASIVETLSPGSIFFVDLYAVGVTNLWGFEFKLDYDASVLTALDISLGHEYFGYYPVNEKFVGEIRDDLGYVSLVMRSWWGDPVGFTGNTSMVRLYFSVDSKGESALHFSKAVLSDTSGKQISKPVTDGVFRNVDPGSIPHAAFTYSPSSPLQGQLITFDASGSTPDGGSITKYKWVFNDEIYLLPDGNGTYTAWPGYARDWDDPVDVLHDVDATFVNATAHNLNESSTLTDLPSIVHTHTITKVRLTVVARTPATSDEKMRLMLIVGGKGYNGSAYDLQFDYMKYTSDWSNNPAGGSWTWSAIDALEAGVRSVQVGSVWTGELRITQMYISVFTVLEVTGSPPNPVTTYFYAMRGSYTVTLGVFDSDGAADSTSAVVTVRGHDVATTSVGHCGYKLLTPTSNSLTYPYWGGSYTDWDDWPSPDGDTTYVYSQPNVVLRPNGNGSKTDWTWANVTVDGDGSYTAWGNSSGFWDDWPTPDGDATYVSATAGGLNETSTLTDPPAGYRSYAIANVRVNVVARNNITGSDEKLRPMIFIGGKPYGGTLTASIKNTYVMYTSNWTKNPSTNSRWTWSEIDALEAGVSSVLTESWTGELRVTQLYVSISTWGDYTAWDDWVNPDEDASYVSITINNRDETSTLEDHTSQDWAIQRVRVNFRARNALATSDERVKPILVKGALTRTVTETSQPGDSYVDYAYDWELSPFTNVAWTWAEIDQLEVGVRSVVNNVDWTGEIRVTQIYITVMADVETSELPDPTTETWDIKTVRVTAVVRNTTAGSNEQFQIAIVAGGQLYLSDAINPNGTYVAYSWQWDKDPSWNAPWLWSSITWLEAGVKSKQIGRDWTGEIRVTQLYVEVFGEAPPSGNLLEVTPGETIRFTVSVQNHGSFNEPSVSSKLYCDDTQVGVQTLSLDIGAIKIFVYVWTVAEVYNGTHWLSFNTTVANEYHVVDDSVTDGKLKVRDYHDIAVTSVTTSAIRAYRGFNRTVTMTVKNWGSYTETGFTVTFKCNSTVIQTKTVASLASRASVVLTFKWNTSLPSVLPYGYYVISGTASSVPSEVTLPNNYKAAPSMVMVTVAGDADGDKNVNIFDILEVQDHWYPGPPLGPGGYDRNVDIDDDGAINIFDILIVQANWDKHW